MEVLIGFVVLCLVVGAWYGKRAPDDADYDVDPAKRGGMQLSTFVYMVIFAGASIIAFMLIATAVMSGILEVL